MNFNNILDIIEIVTRTNKKKFGQTNKGTLNASRDRGQYDCYITAIEIGNNRKFNKLHP